MCNQDLDNSVVERERTDDGSGEWEHRVFSLERPVEAVGYVAS